MAAHTDELNRSGAATGPDAPVALRATGLVRRFGGRQVLDGLDLTVAAGEFVALLGRSGSGKSTLLRAVAGLDDRVDGSGELLVPERVSLSFQDSRLLPWLRLLDNVVLGLRDRSGASRAHPGRGDARRRGSAALAEVGLAGREHAWPGELSGGEQQRAALARALVREPELLLADEPFGALDALTRIRMHGLLRELYERHRPAVLLVTHDVDEAIELADRVVVLQDGRIGLDLPIELPAPRSPGGPRFQEHRATLLAALGVTTDADTSPAPAATGPVTAHAAAPRTASPAAPAAVAPPRQKETPHVPHD